MKNNILKISTIGDSLTEGSIRMASLGETWRIPGIYQSTMYHKLKNEGLNIEITNFGIGGQIISQIAGRMEDCVPADIVTIMGGTNDAWRYSGLAEGIEVDIGEEMLELYNDAILRAIKASKNEIKQPKFVICSVPPVGNVKTLPKKMHSCIIYLNKELERFVAESNLDCLYFCDIHAAMEDSSQYMKKGLCVQDGVHFTPSGNEICGTALAKRIKEILN